MDPRAETTRAALIEAALVTLKEEGYAGTTVRAIASRAGANAALVHYHFGGVRPLLLEALDASSAERLARYREAFAAAGSLEESVACAAELFAEDVRGGHVTVLTELLAASLADPALAPELMVRMEPWLEFTRESIEQALAPLGLSELLPVEEASYALTALYLGLNMLSRLDPDRTQADALFDLMRRFSELAAPKRR